MYKDSKGNTWFRGNMHTHTRNSDGRLPYEEVVELYKNKGYDFLAITDHWNWSKKREEEGFLLLPGCEYDVGSSVQEGIYHIVAIDCDQQPELVRHGEGLTAQRILDEVHKNNGFAILAHPSWSLNRVDKVLPLQGIDATEIYNTFSAKPWNARPYSGDFVDMMAAEGYLLPCMAADDAHRYEGEAGMSYLMVKAEALTEEAIMKALRKGDYIATQGPMMDISIQDGYCIVDCTEARQVVFYSDGVYSADRVTEGDAVTHAQCRLMPHETFIRVEVIDKEGRTAWSSPIALQ